MPTSWSRSLKAMPRLTMSAWKSAHIRRLQEPTSTTISLWACGWGRRKKLFSLGRTSLSRYSTSGLAPTSTWRSFDWNPGKGPSCNSPVLPEEPFLKPQAEIMCLAHLHHPTLPALYTATPVRRTNEFSLLSLLVGVARLLMCVVKSVDTTRVPTSNVSARLG